MMTTTINRSNISHVRTNKYKEYNKRKSNQKKTLFIKSKLRFVIFVASFLVFSVAIINNFINVDMAIGAENEQYIEARVSQGDSLWDIANTYKSDSTDVREAIYEIKLANDLDSSYITEGSIIKIPKTI